MQPYNESTGRMSDPLIRVYPLPNGFTLSAPVKGTGNTRSFDRGTVRDSGGSIVVSCRSAWRLASYVRAIRSGEWV